MARENPGSANGPPILRASVARLTWGPIADRWVPGSLALAYIALWFAAVLTVYTGYSYFRAGLAYTRKRRERIA